MRNLWLLLVIPVVVISCDGKPKSKSSGYEALVPDSLICATINNFVNDTSIHEFQNCNRFVDKDFRKVLLKEDSLVILRLDSIFTKEDMDFIFRQNLNSVYFRSGKCLKNKVLISADTLLNFEIMEFWPKFRKKYGEGGYCSISMPLFSVNHDIVIIRYSRNNGRLNASGVTYIFKKSNGKWIKIYCIDAWIS